MKIILLLIGMLPSLSFAHCPFEIESDGQAYCVDISWQKGEKKVQGLFKPTDKQSPQLIPMGEIPQKWIYSKADVFVWEKGDSNHTSQFIEDFRIFPYMNMEDGHHHSVSYDFKYDSGKYTLQAMGFQKMPGCWSLRWTNEEHDQMGNSSFLMNVLDYENLTDDENHSMKSYCTSGSGSNSGSHSHSH